MLRRIWLSRVRGLPGLTALLLTLLLAGVAVASSGGGYSLNWWSVDGGGERSSAAGYSLSGSSGQPDAATLSGGDYNLRGGFWAGFFRRPAAESITVYLPLIRQAPDNRLVIPTKP